jgi:3-hydroxybutyryl-CoA dehydrogenase
MMNHKSEINTIGIIGLGLMGQGITSCFIRYGFNVIAYSRTECREQETLAHISSSLRQLVDRNAITESETEGWEERFKYVNALEKMGDCQFVVETVGESLELKREIYKIIESVVDEDTVIATNTSGIAISLLQKELVNKKRFIGMHWAEPAEITRYLEISRAESTAEYAVQIGRSIGERCGKQPTLLKYDLPGLISNRMMYAMMREAMYLVEIGVADMETVDRSFRNDIGWWAALCGPFRWMDLTGLPIYAKVMDGLFPELCNGDKAPELIKEKAASKSKFYDYQGDEEKEWEVMWTDFTLDLSELIKKYEVKAKL